MSSTEPLTAGHRRQLLELARNSVREGLMNGHALAVTVADWPEPLQAEGASFVSLHRADGSLRGCIGTLQARQPLVVDVADHAWAAAFRDPRFPPLASGEFDSITIDLSILSTPEPLPVASEPELLATIQPGEDGLVLEDGPHRGTFLPAVWDSLPDPEDFIRELKRKAGLPADHWSPSLMVKRYRTESFSEREW
ncbi:MAG: AmmeMemoRadiSam system protein A [Pseudomonadota bacterium]